MKFKLHFFILVSYLLPKICQQDQVFYYFKYQNDTFAKHWMNYIEAFLTKKTLMGSKSKMNIITSIYNFQTTKTFITLAKKLLSFKHISQEKHKYEYSHNSLIVKILTGELYLSAYASIELGYRIFFNVDKKLTLNVTFLALKFYFEFNHCNTTGIQIRVKHSQINKNATKEDFTIYNYCKQYATFNFYPEFNQIWILTIRDNANFVLPFQLHSRFSVMDSQFVMTNLMTKPYSQTHLPNMYDFHSYIFYNNFLLISYLIQVKKTYQIIISLVNFRDVLVYDGPGFIFNVVNITQNYYITSTFQCIIQHLFTYNSINLEELLSFTVKTIQVNKLIHIGSKNIKFKFPADCLTQLCIIQVLSDGGYHVNFTIVSMFSNSSLGFACLIWGVAVVNATSTEEDNTICNTLDNVLSPSRSFYSVQSTLVIVIYDYENTKTNTMFGMLSRTRCKAIEIDPCWLHYYSCGSATIAQRYLSNIVQFTNVTLSLRNKKLLPTFHNIDINHVFFNLTRNSCAIVQIRDKLSKEIDVNELQSKCKEMYMVHNCYLHLSPKSKHHMIFGVKGDLSMTKI